MAVQILTKDELYKHFFNVLSFDIHKRISWCHGVMVSRIVIAPETVCFWKSVIFYGDGVEEVCND